MLYAISGYTVEKTDTGMLHRGVPSFLLNSACQGIVDEQHARDIAKQIVNPTGNLEVHITAVAWREL